MAHPDIVVIGASAGGIDACKALLGGLPRSLQASVFVVIHISPQSPGYLPVMFTQAGPLPAELAEDGHAFRYGRVYVAPPDRHLLINAAGRMETPRGPRENRVRPAVDPLFRSAAVSYGSRVIGVVLSGGLDDGTAGLRSIKMCGGTTLVQDPGEALVSSMPASALRYVTVDYTAPVAELASLIGEIVSVEINADTTVPSGPMKRKLEFEVNATRELSSGEGITEYGEPSLFTCPECHGSLLAIRGERPARFRCHTGHAFTIDSLLAELSEATEQSIWNSVRSVQESAILLSHLAGHWRETDPKVAEEFEAKAREARHRVDLIKRAAASHEQLSEEKVKATASK